MDIQQLLDLLKSQDTHEKIVSFGRKEPDIVAIENYLNWAIYNNPTAAARLQGLVEESMIAYRSARIAEFERGIAPPEQF